MVLRERLVDKLYVSVDGTGQVSHAGTGKRRERAPLMTVPTPRETYENEASSSVETSSATRRYSPPAMTSIGSST